MTERKKRDYAYNLVLQIVLNPERFFFAAKVEILPGNIMRVIGKKHDVTQSIQPWLMKKLRTKKGSPNVL